MITVIADEEGGIPISAFADFIDVEKVDSYRTEVRPDGSIAVQFFDKDGNLIKGKST
jgi:hypothetical protein